MSHVYLVIRTSLIKVLKMLDYVPGSTRSWSQKAPESQSRRWPYDAMTIVGGSHLSDTTCLTQVVFKSGEYVGN